MKNSIQSFFVSVREEFHKVSWPTRQQTIQTSAIVIIATVVVGIYISIIDYGLSYLIQNFVI
ncbi:MAG TPA: preprotein translocase subunit SecE [bacterium]|nr:preprotein translocase subunit SecE [bacterium]